MVFVSHLIALGSNIWSLCYSFFEMCRDLMNALFWGSFCTWPLCAWEDYICANILLQGSFLYFHWIHFVNYIFQISWKICYLFELVITERDMSKISQCDVHCQFILVGLSNFALYILRLCYRAYLHLQWLSLLNELKISLLYLGPLYFFF